MTKPKGLYRKFDEGHFPDWFLESLNEEKEIARNSRKPSRDLTAEELAEIKAYDPSMTDEKAHEVEAKFPLHTKAFLRSFPDALLHWVDHEIEHNKKITDLKRRRLIEIRDGFEKHFDWLEDIVVYDTKISLDSVIMYAYLIGAMCPTPYETRQINVKARQNTKGRPKPKWNAVADALLLRTPGLPPSNKGKADKIHPGLVEALAAKEPKKKPPSPRTLRDYIGKVGRKRT
jgi:hypothetical protein